MPQRDIIQAAGDYDLGEVAILGSSGVVVNITQQVQELNIFQAIDSPFMSGNIMINDAVGASSSIPILGQERLLFTFKTPGSFAIDFDTYHAVIYNVDKRFQGTNRAQILLLSFTTLENYRNTRVKVSKSFQATPSQIAEELLRDSRYLNTKKSLHIDNSIHIKNYIAPNIRPYQVINTMANEAVTPENEPHFLFYENPRGIHFRSMDSLLGQGGEVSMPHVRSYKYQPSSENSQIDDSMSTILNWEIEESSNTFLNGRAGMFASTLTTHDIYNKNAQKYGYDYVESMFKKRNSLNQNDKKYGPLISETPVEGDKRINDFPQSRQFLHSKTKDTNFAETWMQESHSRRLESEFFTINIEVFGDTNVMCGDIIEIIIPMNRPLGAADTDSFADPILSGRYLVIALAHQINHPTQQHVMNLTAMKDSVTNAVPTKIDMKYPREKKSQDDIGLTQEKRSLTKRPKVEFVRGYASTET